MDIGINIGITISNHIEAKTRSDMDFIYLYKVIFFYVKLLY